MINPESLRRTRRMRHAPRPQPRASRGSAVRHREGDERRLDVASRRCAHADVPERIDIVLVNGDPNPNRPDLPPYGAGEASCKPMHGRHRQRHLRRDRRSPPPGSVPGRSRARSAQSRRCLTLRLVMTTTSADAAWGRQDEKNVAAGCLGDGGTVALYSAHSGDLGPAAT